MLYMIVSIQGKLFVIFPQVQIVRADYSSWLTGAVENILVDASYLMNATRQSILYQYVICIG